MTFTHRTYRAPHPSPKTQAPKTSNTKTFDRGECTLFAIFQKFTLHAMYKPRNSRPSYGAGIGRPIDFYSWCFRMVNKLSTGLTGPLTGEGRALPSLPDGGRVFWTRLDCLFGVRGRSRVSCDFGWNGGAVTLRVTLEVTFRCTTQCRY